MNHYRCQLLGDRFVGRTRADHKRLSWHSRLRLAIINYLAYIDNLNNPSRFHYTSPRCPSFNSGPAISQWEGPLVSMRVRWESPYVSMGIPLGDRPYLNMKGTGPAISSQSGTRTGGLRVPINTSFFCDLVSVRTRTKKRSS